MLIIRIIDEDYDYKKRKKWFCRRNVVDKKYDEVERYSINVNGKNVIVLELNSNSLLREDVVTLLNIYKGRVLVAEKNKQLFKEYLYIPKEYYKRAILSSLVNQAKTVNKAWQKICIKTESFTVSDEYYEIVRLSKKVTLITQLNPLTESFINDCYYKYGAVVGIKDDADISVFDVFLDLDEIDDSGKLMINVQGKEYLLYPDATYFSTCEEYQKLQPFNIEHNIVCSVFSDK